LARKSVREMSRGVADKCDASVVFLYTVPVIQHAD
jgi:hypothetical protein